MKKLILIISLLLPLAGQAATWEQWSEAGMGHGADKSLIIPGAVYNDYLYIRAMGNNGSQLWRAQGEGAWEQVGTNGFGDTNNVYLSGLREINGYLYFTAYGTWTTSCQLWRTDGTAVESVGQPGFGDIHNNRVIWVGQINDYYYLSFDNNITGVEIWRTKKGLTWEQVNIDGFGDSSNRYVYNGFQEFNGYYYISIINYDTGVEIWRTPDGTTWEQAATDGFGDANMYLAHLMLFKNYLYALVEPYGDGIIEVWRTADGITWESAASEGFGDTENSNANTATVGDYLYVSTDNDAGAGQVWRTDGIEWVRLYPESSADTDDAGLDLYNAHGTLFAYSINIVDGVRIWNYDNGQWMRWNEDAINGDVDNFWGYLYTYDQYMVFCTYNSADGGSIWRADFSADKIEDLEIISSRKKKLKLQWIAPAGTSLDHYDVRYYTEPITNDNWHEATVVSQTQVPQTAGAVETATVSSMPTDRTYYLSVKTLNSSGTESDVSNVVTAIRKVKVKKIKRRTARLRWSSDEEAEYYNLQLRTKKGKRIKTWKHLTNTKRVIHNNYLKRSKKYKFRARSINWDNEKSAWSRYKSFTTNK